MSSILVGMISYIASFPTDFLSLQLNIYKYSSHMKPQNRLHIYEEILLLALRDKQGTIFYDVHYPQALAAAILAELLLIKKVVS